MNKLEVLKTTNVGERIAEQETEGLSIYFLKTFLWEQILEDDIDIVFGCKGSGKSAIYNFLANQTDEIFDRNGILAFAENPRGTVAFKDLNTSPPTEESEFKSIWKLYFILIISQKLLEFNYNDQYIKTVISKLQDSNLIARRPNFTSMVKMVRDYIRNVKSIEPNISISDSTGLVDTIGVKISLNEPSTRLADKGIVSIDYLLECLNNSLKLNGFKIWVAIDRLDAIFQDNFQLEANALKTLFQVYIDLMGYENIRLLIFFRDDIWNRIIEDGFRESSHLTRKELITWDESALFHLIMCRFIKNAELLNYYGLKQEELVTKEQQLTFFAKIFPKETMQNGIFDFNWLISKIEDGNKNVSPRELIHLINLSIKQEIKCIIEEGGITNDCLISEASLWKALAEVSKTKLETILSEYPKLQPFIYRLKKKKISSTAAELKTYWDCSNKDVKIIANNLVKIGILRNKNEFKSGKEALYYIPQLYRSALGL
ncbi:MAG: P-loop ATPase, Sll1717 family [Candidatus Saccharimonadaceae bacterium]